MTSNENESVEISKNKLFLGLKENELFEVCAQGKNSFFEPGAALFKNGNSNEALFLITSGSIKLTQNQNGQEKDIAVLQAGEGVSNSAFIDDSTKTVSAIAVKQSNITVVDKLSMEFLASNIQSLIQENFKKVVPESAYTVTEDTHGHEAKLLHRIKYLESRLRIHIHTNSDNYGHSEFIQNLLENLPSLPMYTSNLIMLLQGEDPSTREIVEQAKSDPSLVSVILKTINSAYYGLRSKISDVQHAITYLGFNQVYQLVVDNGIKSVMPDTAEFQELQRHSNVISIMSFEIARLCKKDKPVLHGTIGMLHHIGNNIAFLLKERHKDIEMLIDLLDYARIGSLLLEKWNVPDDVFKSIEYQYFPESLPPSEVPEEYRENVAILYIAHLCYEQLKDILDEEISLEFFDEYAKTINLSETSFLPLFKDHIMPAVNKKANSYPENVRKFLKETQE